MWRAKDFEGRRDATIKYFKKNLVNEGNIAEYCSISGVPIIVTCEFIIDEFPEHTEVCQKKIREIKQFFGIKD